MQKFKKIQRLHLFLATICLPRIENRYGGLAGLKWVVQDYKSMAAFCGNRAISIYRLCLSIIEVNGAALQYYKQPMDGSGTVFVRRKPCFSNPCKPHFPQSLAAILG